MKSTGKRSDAKNMAKCKVKTYYYCIYYGQSCPKCEFNINIKRQKALLELKSSFQLKKGKNYLIGTCPKTNTVYIVDDKSGWGS